jgi:hypothetical protein
MTFLGSTMSALKAILRGTSRTTNYQTLPSSEGEVEGHRDNTDRDHDHDHDQAVYLSFWLFGAGCLLGWNGSSRRSFMDGADE